MDSSVMNRNPWSIIANIVLLISLSSCTAVLDLDPKERFVVVHAVLINEPKQIISLHYTSYLSDDYQQPINDGQVVVEEENDDSSIQRTFSFTPKGDGLWEADFTPLPEMKYNLRVNIPSEKEITASTVFPSTENLLFLLLHDTDYSFLSRYIPLYLWIYGMDYDEQTQQSQTTEFIFGYSSQGYVDAFNCSNKTLQDCPELKNTLPAKESPNALLNYGYLRCEIGTSTDQKLKEDEDIHLKALPSFQLCENGYPHPKSKVFFDSVSAEYDQYLKSVLLLKLSKMNKTEQDFSELYDYDDAASNIKNGIGIFGAVYRNTLNVAHNNYTN